MVNIPAGSSLEVWVSLCIDGEIFEAHKVLLSKVCPDIDDLSQAASETTFKAELGNVGLLQRKVFKDSACTEICKTDEKLEGLAAGKSATNPLYICVLPSAAGTLLLIYSQQ
jgi:hypothetical protein